MSFFKKKSHPQHEIPEAVVSYVLGSQKWGQYREDGSLLPASTLGDEFGIWLRFGAASGFLYAGAASFKWSSRFSLASFSNWWIQHVLVHPTWRWWVVSQQMNGEDHSDLGNPSIFHDFSTDVWGRFPGRKMWRPWRVTCGVNWSQQMKPMISLWWTLSSKVPWEVIFFHFFQLKTGKQSQWMQGMASHCIFFPIFSSIFQLKTRKSWKPGVNAKGRPLYGTRPDGLMPRHVYSVLRAVEVPGEIWEEPKRMVCLRNPWGRCEWQGTVERSRCAPDFGWCGFEREREIYIYIYVCVCDLIMCANECGFSYSSIWGLYGGGPQGCRHCRLCEERNVNFLEGPWDLWERSCSCHVQ